MYFTKIFLKYFNLTYPRICEIGRAPLKPGTIERGKALFEKKVKKSLCHDNNCFVVLGADNINMCEYMSSQTNIFVDIHSLRNFALENGSSLLSTFLVNTATWIDRVQALLLSLRLDAQQKRMPCITTTNMLNLASGDLTSYIKRESRFKFPDHAIFALPTAGDYLQEFEIDVILRKSGHQRSESISQCFVDLYLEIKMCKF